MKWNSKKILLMICVGLTGSALFSFNKGDDRNFQIAKNLDIFNAIFKEVRPCGDSLPMWYGTVRAGIHPAPCLAAAEISV